MSLKRTTIIFVGGVALAAWLSAAMTPGRPPAASIAIRPAPIDAKRRRSRGRDRAAARTAAAAMPRLARPLAIRSSSGRRRAALGRARRARRRRRTRRALPPMSVEPPRLRLTLAGIAEDPGPRAARACADGDHLRQRPAVSRQGRRHGHRSRASRVQGRGRFPPTARSSSSLRDSTIHRLALK